VFFQIAPAETGGAELALVRLGGLHESLRNGHPVVVFGEEGPAVELFRSTFG
jgi:hypothetical protein